ncbi:MAG: JAB domain-containing protein [Legionella sp.]
MTALGNKQGKEQMHHLTSNEKTIIKQAIEILDSKLRTKDVRFDCAASVKQYLRLQLESCEREHMTALYLDTQHRLIEYRKVFSGVVNSCSISAREFVKDALSLNATAIIIAHNHPSGHAEPSREDIKATLNLKDALNVFDIKLIDHFIVGHNEIKSLAELNLI